MGDAYIFSLKPTFTQGLILGQFSILFLLVLILKYLFFDTSSERPYKISAYQPRTDVDSDDQAPQPPHETLESADPNHTLVESADWLNVVVQHASLDASISVTVLNV